MLNNLLEINHLLVDGLYNKMSALLCNIFCLEQPQIDQSVPFLLLTKTPGLRETKELTQNHNAINGRDWILNKIQ